MITAIRVEACPRGNFTLHALVHGYRKIAKTDAWNSGIAELMTLDKFEASCNALVVLYMPSYMDIGRLRKPTHEMLSGFGS